MDALSPLCPDDFIRQDQRLVHKFEVYDGTNWIDLSQDAPPQAAIDGEFAYWDDSTNLTFWAKVLGGTGTLTRAGSLPNYCVQLNIDGSGTLTYVYQSVTLTPLTRYNITFWYKTTSGHNAAFYMRDLTDSYYLQDDYSWSATLNSIVLPDTSGAWVETTIPFTSRAVTGYICSLANDTADSVSATINFDDFSIVPEPGCLRSMSCSVAGAGRDSEPIAGSWSVTLDNPEGIFHPYHSTSAYKDLIRIGRKTRLSWGVAHGGLVNFDGVNDYIEVADNALLDITTNITIEAWVKQNVRDSWATIVSKGTSTSWGSNNYVLGLQSGRVDFRYGSAGSVLVDAGDVLTLGTWYHIVAVADTGTTNALRVYINGVEKKTGTRSGSPTANSQVLRFGTEAITTSGDWFEGALSEARIYSRALTATEVSQHYECRYENDGDLVGSWHYGEESGLALDSSGNSLDGTLYGATRTRTQLLPNEGLENWTTSTNLADWTEDISGTSTVTQETSVVHGGTSAVRFNVISGQAGIYTGNIGLKPGEAYRFSGWYNGDGSTPARVWVYSGDAVTPFQYSLSGTLGDNKWMPGSGSYIALPAVSSWTYFNLIFTTIRSTRYHLVSVSGDANYPGVTYFDDLRLEPVAEERPLKWWQRIIGYMDTPRFDGDQSITISGTDYAKALTDTGLFSPWTQWGDSETFDSKASPGGTGTEIYAEADACDPVSEADNVTNWAVGGSGGSVSSEGPGDESDYFLHFIRDSIGPTTFYTQNTNVGSVTAGNEYLVKFWARVNGDHSCNLGIYQSVGASLYLVGSVPLSGGGEWFDYEKVVSITSTGAMMLRLNSTGKYAADEDSVDLDEVSIKLYDPTSWNIYELPAECRGVYYVVLNDEPVWQGDEDGKGGWHYDPDLGPGGALFFSEELVIDAGTANLDIYYYTDTAPEDVIADLLVASSLYTTRALAKAAMNYTATGIVIPRVRFESGSSAFDAVRLVCERANYRFWFGFDGQPNFVPAPIKTTPSHFDLGSFGNITAIGLYQDIEEVRNHITIEGDERSVLNVSTGQVEKSTWKASAEDATSIAAYKRKTYSLTNPLFQTQASATDMATALLAAYKEPKFYVELTISMMPIPLEVGDTITISVPVNQTTAVTKYGIIRAMSISELEASLTLELYVPYATTLVVQDAALGLANDAVTLDYAGALAPDDATMGMAADSPSLIQVFEITTTYSGGTLSIPDGATTCVIEAWAGGGNGGNGEMVGRAGGGGGGGYSKTTITDIDDSLSFTIWLPDSGAGEGCYTTIEYDGATICEAENGMNGDLTQGGAGGAAANGIGDTKYSGGNGYFYATGNTGGGGGGSAGTASNGNNAISSSGATAVTGGGGGGNGGARYNDGYDGSAPGGGGGGAGSDLSVERYGGSGRIGKVRFTFS